MKHYLLLFAAFAALFFFTSCESRKTIVNGLDEKEANEILVFLSTKGIIAQKVPAKEASGGGGAKIQLWDISVSEEEAREAMSTLNQAGLPRRRSQSLLNIFSNVGLVPSEMQDKIRYQSGLAEQIASTIRKIDGVLDSEVQISFPDEDPLNPGANKQKITASVYVKHNGVLDDPNTHLITKIKRLVAASVPNLNYDNVTVIPDRARFSEYPTGTLQGSLDDEKQFVNIWTLIISKESVTRFRIIFFTLLSLLLLLTLALIWLGWKLYPVIEKHGGFKELLHMHPLEKKDENNEESQEKRGETDSVKEGQTTINKLEDKDIDET